MSSYHTAARKKMAAHLGRELTRVEIVHHHDGNIRNNDLSNLELMTRSEHQMIHTYWPGEANPNAKLTWQAVEEIRSSELPNGRLAGLYGVSEATISMVKRNLKWR